MTIDCFQVISRFIHHSSATFFSVTGSRALFHQKLLLVLDSSYNPPHEGHFNLIKQALSHFRKNHTNSDGAIGVLLQLSVQNVDKSPKPASFDKRLEMMLLMAQDVEEQLNCTCFVSLSKCGKFIDKSKDIFKNFEQPSISINNNEKGFKIVYLLGFDTLVRLFDIKYYSPLSVEEALGNFMKSNELFCLTRSSSLDKDNEQVRWLENNKNIPLEWKNKITLHHNSDEKLSNISSSNIRALVVDGEIKSTQSLVSNRIFDYINKNPKLFTQ
ncbi:related to Promoter of filamentation protein 1 [Saccharomycodes ludwigii]|uniref:Related to Promoter of filamentation protein 1 n=1 Tax=Saccharomycodes ludwigii TaxID=36035 RepID=A0A376B6I9_9ASCO|nr:related to Promoter of filamentation protein 1 [Saccharomycodes ludwigii]